MDLSRQEYPALLQSLQPSQAVAVLDERVRLIGRVNSDIAEWLSVQFRISSVEGNYSQESTQERRRVEETYVQGLKKLGARHPTTVSAELG
ncbi:MAG: hypothetical protein Q9222_006852 [Ikaeria aurantiellina]